MATTERKLDKTFINNLQRRMRDGRHEVGSWYADQKQDGLILKVQQGTATWCCRGRVHGSGRRFDERLGSIDDLSPDEARDAAHDMRRNARQGTDPRHVRRAEAERIADEHERTLQRLIDEWLKAGLPGKNTSNVVPKQSTVGKYRAQLYRDVVPSWGDRPLSTLTEADVREMQQRLVRKGSLRQADILRAVLMRLFTWARKRGWIERNWAADLPKHADTHRDAPDYDARTFAELLGELRQRHEAGAVGGSISRCMMFIAVTGWRLEEARTMRWDRVRGDRYVIPDSKKQRGPQIREEEWHINAAARDVLAMCPKKDGNPHIFWGHTTGQPFVSPYKTVWYPVRRAIGMPHLRIHDLRHWVGHRAAEQGLDMRQIQHLLHHAQLSTTERYVKRSYDVERDAAERVGVLPDVENVD